MAKASTAKARMFMTISKAFRIECAIMTTVYHPPTERPRCDIVETMDPFLVRKIRLWIEIIAVLALLSVGAKTLIQASESPAINGVVTYTQYYVGLTEAE